MSDYYIDDNGYRQSTKSAGKRWSEEGAEKDDWGEKPLTGVTRPKEDTEKKEKNGSGKGVTRK